MLSKRITENRRLLTAAPAIKHRIITRSKPRVFRPVACLRNCPSSAAAAMFAGEREKKVNEWFWSSQWAASTLGAIVNEHTFPTPRLGTLFRRHACHRPLLELRTTASPLTGVSWLCHSTRSSRCSDCAFKAENHGMRPLVTFSREWNAA